ncbi:hypothetical protein H9L39_04483 [Fusarium oxysporum f. sp. albedinis]|nr:hypothetical protein H9L39_04483 [Fusarium oxysporum f. sp. albedinis]
MPGSWDAESPSTTKTHEYYERDIGTRKGTSQHPLKEFHHSREIFNFLSSPGEAQPQSLRKAEPSLTTEEIADEKADRLTKKVMSMEHRLSSHMTLASKAKELAEENRVLREQFNDAQSHIFSLQPYRKDLTPEEVGQDYDALVEQIQDWVQKLVNPWLEDCDDDAHAFLTHAKRRKADANRFKIEPKRDHFTVRTWTAEAYNTLLSCPRFKPVRQRQAKEMAVQLSDILGIFPQEENLHSCYQDLTGLVVYAAIRLYEKLQISTNHFYLDINSFLTSVG